jgi:hypothetical protein
MTSSYSLAVRHPEAIFEGSARGTGLLLTAVLVFLFAANIYDTGGALGAKYVAFFVVCFFSLWTLKYFCLSPRTIALGLLLFVAWPTWALLFGAARGGDVSVGLSQVTPFLFGLLLALILPSLDNRQTLRLFYVCLFSLAIVVIVSFALIFLLPENSISQRLFETLTSLHEREGYFGTRSLGDLDSVPNIYFGSTLFLVPAFVYYLFAGRALLAGVVLLAIGVTFSKAGISIALAFGAIYFIRALLSRDAVAAEGIRMPWRSRFRRFFPVVLLGGCILGILVFVPDFAQDIRDAWSGESETALVRIGHFRSVVNLFLDHPHYLVVGQGVGVPFFTTGESSYVQNIEIDHLNTVRKFGLPWFVCFSTVVFYSAWRLIKADGAEMQACGFALVSMYFAAGTNPVLTSPLFIMMMTLSYFAQRRGRGRAS